MYLDQWLSRRNSIDDDPASWEVISKKRSLRLKISETRRELNARRSSEEHRLDQLLIQLEEQLADAIREAEGQINRSFDRKLARRSC